MASRVIALALVVLSAAPAQAQRSDQRPIAELPSSVRAAGGRFTVFADFASAADARVPVYLVNQTSATITLETQDGNPYLVREAEVDGRWVRAQPFLFSDCGLSYYSLVIQPSHFVRVAGSFPGAGERSNVRYRLARHAGEIVSNLGAGRFSRDEVLAASHDALAMESANVRAIEAALFRAPPLSREVRHAAFARLRDLPPREGMPLLLRILGDAASAEDDLDQAMRTASTLDPDALARHVLGLVERGPSRLRAVTLSHLRHTAISDGPLVAQLLALAARPGEPDLRPVLDVLAGTRRQEVRAALIAIRDDARYAVGARTYARYQLEQWFSTDVVGVIAQPVGNYSDGHRIPVRMTVRLTNTGDRSIDFRYSRLTDFLSFYVSRDDGAELEFIEPRPSVRWFTTPGAASTAVHLAPGEVRELSFELLEYFDLPTDGSARVTVWTSVSIPGVHDVPHVGGGAGVNVQP